MNMNTTKPAFTRDDLELETAIDLLENLVNSINGDPEMFSYDQDQAHAFLEAYFKHRQENEVTEWIFGKLKLLKRSRPWTLG